MVYAWKFIVALTIVSYCAGLAWSHGPQLQVTQTDHKITTHEVILDGPYSDALTAMKSVYVMPIAPYSGVWYSHPNDEIDSITHLPAFPSGPGLAYGFDLADGGDQAFAEGSHLTIEFVAGLKRWNGTDFTDAGATQLKAFRGSDPTIATPVENFAVTSDTAPWDSLSLAAVAAGYGTEGIEAHGSIRYALLGDGVSPTSEGPDGIYLASLQLTSDQVGVASSDPYYFVLNKNGASIDLQSAVQSLHIDAGRIQYVPEPASATALALSFLGVVPFLRRARCDRQTQRD